VTQEIRIDRRRFLLASLGGVAALAAASCASGSGTGQSTGRTVRLPQGAAGFPTPFAANADIGYAQASLVYDTLLWKDGGGQLLPWLAQSFTTSADHLTYTFQLRPNVTWSDGRPLTADDVVFTFDYGMKQQVFGLPVIIQPPQGIAKVTAPDPRTVQITLDGPAVTFPEQVAGAVLIVPRHIWSGIGDPTSSQDLKILVGSGPYRVTSFDAGTGTLLYVARNDFFLGSPFVGRIEELAVNDPISPLLSGQTDYGSGVQLPADELAPFESNPAFGITSNVGASTQAMYWNLAKLGPLSDVRFRRAMLMAIDRQDLVTRIAAGRGAPGNPGFLAPQNPFFTPVTQYGFDVAGANSLLDAAGYPLPNRGATRRDATGAPLSFGLLMDNAQAPLAEILVADLRRVGIELKPNLVQLGPQLFGNKYTGSYDIAVLQFPGPGPGGPDGDPDVLRRLFSSRLPASLQGASAYANPTFDRLADQQLITFDPVARKAIVAQMQMILSQDVPVVPLYYPEWFGIFRKQVLDQWYFTPGQFPANEDNKQLFVTGMKTGTAIRRI
jgi:peptide/nickel transport system substrate-binding protein